MKPYKKLDPVKAAHKFANQYYPDCQGAILAGSVVRGEATETSDLDIIIFDRMLSSSYRESLIEFDWPIEVFLHNFTSYRQYFKSDCERARPSLPRMVAEGIVLKDDGIIGSIKQEAQALLEKGPEEWPAKTIEMKRYFITDTLEDLIGSSHRDEQLFIANTLAELVSEFVLRTNRRWIGTSKWTVRALKNYDEKFANEFVEVFDVFYQTDDKSSIIRLVDEILKPYGGRLFEGFSLGKDK
ncbi:nucleotidyltransferase domain-containing protein [Thalassobacillus devorans]|uniref:nucleotidyltransferase domain-containing protein n=1 Tax=Thalassobacillus devorans TaxID=279813 RepID=UPI00048FEAF5|nr:nucleotidyltransferase domain-containing protein [Thalassobacillus devorans]